VTRTVCLVCLAAFLSPIAIFSQVQSNSSGQNPPATAQEPAAKAPPSQNLPDEAMPPEEDESVAPEKYSLDPLESERNIKVGNYYWHKGKYRAALGRYERATKYNPSSAEAFFKVGEAEEKLKNRDAARIAFQRVIQIAPDSKLAQEARKKLGNKS
jgi:tetratricopeptide (TPR) repeat protein